MGGTQGGSGGVTRLGTKRSGMTAWAASWKGRVKVRLWHDERTGRDMCTVTQEPHQGAGISENVVEFVVGGPTNFRKVDPFERR